VHPQYSEKARRAKHGGTVLLDIVVDAEGNVARYKVTRGIGFGLDEEAIQSVKKWKFDPGHKDGRPVAEIASVEISFHLLGGAPDGGLQAGATASPDGPLRAIYHPGPGVTSPELLSKVEPEYSEAARQAKIEGMVFVKCVVDEEGWPRDVQVVQGLGMGLDEKAMEAVRRWRFKPAFKDGKPVAMIANVQVTFRLL
jgi:TonB family protein